MPTLGILDVGFWILDCRQKHPEVRREPDGRPLTLSDQSKIQNPKSKILSRIAFLGLFTRLQDHHRAELSVRAAWDPVHDLKRDLRRGAEAGMRVRAELVQRPGAVRVSGDDHEV